MQTNHTKISDSHLSRRAIVYLRQSSMKQVRENKESQRLQYGLVDRARQLGWQMVDVIDSDLGFSAGQHADEREGFKRLLGAIALGEVGIVFAREASRLSRTDRDWCHLIEVCQMHDTLVGDGEQVYDTNAMDDQLVLGIKGTLSVIELKVLKMRLLQGMEEKAKRGALVKTPPVGYVGGNEVPFVKDPNVRVQESISLVFRKFRELWSIRQTFMWFRDNHIELPVNKTVGRRDDLNWKIPTHSLIVNILKNPTYAGAYVYGRRPTERQIRAGRVIKRQGRPRRFDEVRVFIKDHHEGYITWQIFEENQRMIGRNCLRENRDEAAMAVRTGHGLLTGLLRCGRCGRKLHIRYWGKSGTAARYMCDGSYAMGGKRCVGFGGATVDKRFEEEVLGAISPLGIAASLRVLGQRDEIEGDRRKSLELKLDQARYEAERAFEQFNRVDPKNRLVAETLESRWNSLLSKEEEIRHELQAMASTHTKINVEDRQAIEDLGRNFETVWNHPATGMDFKKKIARLVFKEITVSLNEETKMLHFIIFWNGGSHTEFQMLKPMSGAKTRKTNLEAVEVIQKMAHRYNDGEIARVLNRLGHMTGAGKKWNQSSVAHVRKQHAISSADPAKRAADDILNLAQAEKHTGVSDTTIMRLIREGVLAVQQAVPYAPLEINKTDLDNEPVIGIIRHLKSTGKLIIGRDPLPIQPSLFQ